MPNNNEQDPRSPLSTLKAVGLTALGLASVVGLADISSTRSNNEPGHRAQIQQIEQSQNARL